MSSYVHPMAAVDPEAVLADGVRVGPFAVVGAGVEIGEDTEIGGGAEIQGPTRIGRGNRIFPHACIGFEPQDLSYRGETVRLEIGDRNQFREFTTVNRGTVKGGGVTTIADDNLFMAYSHVGHDCRIGSRTVFVNNATLAGHVEVHDDATISAFSAVHQFCRVGRHGYIGGYTVVTMDALPFVKTVGQKAAFFGLNSIGLRRKGYSAPQVAKLNQAVRILVRSGLNTRQAIDRLREELTPDADVEYLIEFVAGAKRGVHKSSPRGGRDADDAAAAGRDADDAAAAGRDAIDAAAAGRDANDANDANDAAAAGDANAAAAAGDDPDALAGGRHEPEDGGR